MQTAFTRGAYWGEERRERKGTHNSLLGKERDREAEKEKQRGRERHREAETQKERKMSRTWGEEKRRKGEEVGGALPFKERDMAHVHREHTVDQSIVCVLGMRAG